MKNLAIYNDTAEFTVKSELYGVTTCVVDIKAFKEGRRVFPCGDGDDHRLTEKEQRELLEAIQ